MTRVIVITPPQPVVTLDEAKDHLHLTQDREDAQIRRFISAATAHIDGYESWLGRSIGLQTLEARFDGSCHSDGLWLPCPPVVEVISVKFFNSDRVEQTVNPSDYELIDRTIYPISGAAPWAYARSARETIRVRYRAGYVADPEADPLVGAAPDDIKAAILLMVGDLHANRDTVVFGASAAEIPMSLTVERLLSKYRVYA